MDLAFQSVKGRIEALKIDFGLSDELTFQKMAFAYFEKGLSRSKIEGYQEYQWFSGSLCAELFSRHVGLLLSSGSSKSLSDETLLQLRRFVHSIENGGEQASLIDLARAKKISYLSLAKTGYAKIPDGGVNFEPTEEGIEQLIQVTLKKIQSLSVGKAVSFLGGAPIHEVQLCVERYGEEEWRLFICDSAKRHQEAYALSRMEMADPNFWRPIFLRKLSTASNGWFIPEEKRVRDARISHAGTSPQRFKSCHTKSLYRLLKLFVVYRSSLSLDRCLIEWKQLKVDLGRVIRESRQFQCDAKLIPICKKGHERHLFSLEKAKLFERCIGEKRYEETVELYREAYRALSLIAPATLQESALASLHLLHKEFVKMSRKSSAAVELLESLRQRCSNLWVQRTLDTAHQKILKDQIRSSS